MIENVLKVLQKDVEKAFSVKLNENTRRRDVVNGRIAFGYIARKHLKKRYQAIGNFINKDHATAIHYVKTFEGIYKYDDDFRDMFDKLTIDDYLIRNKESIQEEIERLEYKVNHFKKRLEDAI